jgi:glycosyltransferase involved in cell wall biosynthesis
MILIIVTLLLFIIYSGLLLLYRYGWTSADINKSDFSTYKPITPITVIIPARNEEDNIADCIQAILNQQYPQSLFEIIVVNDFSSDATVERVNEFKQPNIKLLQLANFTQNNINSYKKKAIEIAIAHANGTLIVTTDADCTMGSQWLQSIAAYYEKEKKVFIAAPVLISNTGKFIEIFQSLDFMTLQGITGAAVSKNWHSMCNGANLIYEKIAFEKVNGFSGIDAIASGDDMLLMHKIAQAYPQQIGFLKSTAAIVTTTPVSNIGSFFNQRIRWASKADKYNDKSLFPVLLIVYLFNIVLLFIPLMAIFNNLILGSFSFFNSTIHFSLLAFWVIVLFFKTMVELFFLFPVAAFFNNKKLLWWFPLMQPFHIIYTVIAGWLGKFGKYEWKNRKVA